MPGIIPPARPVPPKPKPGLQGPVGRPTSGLQGPIGKPKPMAGLSIKEQQQRLVHAGYNVTVDGIEGPQTAMARKALINGVAPGYWNKVWLKNHSTSAGSRSGGQPPGSSASSGASTSSASTTSRPKGTTRSGGTKQVTPASPTDPGLIDPTAYAAAAANAEFGPQISNANYNLNYAQKALPESLKDLSDWNKQVTDTFNNNDAGAGYQPGIDQAQAAAGNVANLFGESTSAESQAANEPSLAMLQGLQGNQKGFQDIMQSVLAAQGRDYARRATREGNVDITKAQGERGALLAQKGQAQSKYKFDAQNTLINQQQAKQALDQAAALAPGEQAIQKAQVQVAQTNAKNAPAIARLNLKKAELETQATISALKKQSTSGTINWADPSVVDQVSNSGLQGSLGPNGGFVLRPDFALQNLLVTAQGAGAPASVIQMGISKLVRALNISHGKKQWNGWSWNGHKFVLDKSKQLQK